MSATEFRKQYGSHPFATRAKAVMTSGNTRSTVFVDPAPPYAELGQGCRVTDQLGHVSIDCNNNYTSLIHGHARRQINDAVTRVLQTGTAFGIPTESEIALAELLKERTGYQQWRFSNSGTEAVMTAIRAARAYTGRDVLIRFEGSYHGTADVVVPKGAPGLSAGVDKDVLVLPQGDRDAFDRAIEYVGGNLAAVLIDLLPNRAGMKPAEQDFVDHIRAVTTRLGALMIIDEVITLRLAEAGFASKYNVQADLVTAGKIIGGGFPVGAVAGRQDVLAVFDPRITTPVSWGGTFSANPVTMTAGRVALEEYDNTAISDLNNFGDILREKLLSAGVLVNGYGSLMRILEPASQQDFWWETYQRGVMLGTNGLLALSTAMKMSDLEEIAKAVINSVAAVRERYSDE